MTIALIFYIHICILQRLRARTRRAPEKIVPCVLSLRVVRQAPLLLLTPCIGACQTAQSSTGLTFTILNLVVKVLGRYSFPVITGFGDT